MINPKTFQNKTNKNLLCNCLFFLILSLMVIKFCLQVRDNCQQKYHLEVPFACYTAKQRSPKLSNYYPNTYSRIADANSNVRSMPIGDGTQTDRQKTPGLGSIFLPNFGWCSYYRAPMPHLNQNMQQIIAFYNKNHRVVSFMQKLICTRFAVSFKSGLPNAYILNGN